MNNICLNCGSTDRYENQAFSVLPRVTSDSVPFPAGGRLCVCLQCGLIQKIIDEAWKSEIDSIYRDYKMYEITDGLDQILFGEGGITRAERITEILSEHISPGFSGSVLDIGCGTGGFLQAFGSKYPEASLYGQEIDDKNLRYLKRIPNFKTLFTAQPNSQTFDVIVSIHCFEHIYNYENYFAEIKAIKNDSSRILLQVPDVDISSYDIVIADHAAHFSQETLQACLNRYLPGFAVSKPINKELTAITTGNNVKTASTPTPEECIRQLDTHVSYLTNLLALIEDQKLVEFGVYGTTIAGAWLTAAFKDKIAFYVDDDPLKQGKKFHDKKIVAANDTPKNCKVVMPFGTSTVRAILNKHADLQPRAVYYNQ